MRVYIYTVFENMGRFAMIHEKNHFARFAPSSRISLSRCNMRLVRFDILRFLVITLS